MLLIDETGMEARRVTAEGKGASAKMGNSIEIVVTP
jgi:hypothetical protein